MAARFWVGGTGTWDASDQTHWSATTGPGNAPQTVPTAADTVTFDANSGGGTVTVSIATISLTSLTTGAFTGTLDFSATTALTLGTNGWSNTGTGTRTITLGATVVTITTGNNMWLWTTTTSCTFNAGTSEIIIGGGTTASSRAIQLGTTGLTYNKLTLNAITSGFHNTSFAYTTSVPTITTLTVNPGNYLVWPSTPTLNVGTLVMTGTNATPIALACSSLGTSATIALTNASTADWSVFRDCTITGSTVTASNSLNLGRNSGVTITPPSGGGSVGVIGG